MSKKQAHILQNIGMLLIVGVMAADHFLFAIPENVILVCAVLSALFLMIAIKVQKRYTHPGTHVCNPCEMRRTSSDKVYSIK